MPRRLRLWAPACAVFAAVCLSVPGCEPKPDAGPVLLYGADNQGIIAACGCPSNPSGGFAKRQGLIEHYRRRRQHVVVVDAGDMFPDYEHPAKVKYLAMALARARYDALGLGDQELMLGPARLKALMADYGLPLVCSNVRDESGQFIVLPHVVREVAGRRIGIFAVVADAVYGWPPMEWRRGLRVEPPVQAARREVQALADCDVIVALSHQLIHETRQLAAEVPGIDVVVSGHDPAIIRKPEKVGTALVVATGETGRILGALTLTGGRRGRWTFDSDMTELSAHVPEAKWALDLYWQYVRESKDAPPPDWNEVPIPARFEPAAACGKCHPAEFKQWKTTRHARSYESIRKARRHEDPECLLCHTMGFGRQGGFVSVPQTPDLGRVTCQACHIVTSDHADRKVKPDPRTNINSRLCMACHGPVQSPEFDYFVYKRKILHGPQGAGK